MYRLYIRDFPLQETPERDLGTSNLSPDKSPTEVNYNSRLRCWFGIMLLPPRTTKDSEKKIEKRLREVKSYVGG